MEATWLSLNMIVSPATSQCDILSIIFCILSKSETGSVDQRGSLGLFSKSRVGNEFAGFLAVSLIGDMKWLLIVTVCVENHNSESLFLQWSSDMALGKDMAMQVFLHS